MRIGDYAYRSTIAPMGGQFWIPLAAEHRNGAGVAAGEEIDVEVELDNEPRIVEVPADFAAALAREPAAKQAFEGMSYSHQRRHVLVIEDAKTPETRQRRIAKAVNDLTS